jgi:2-polyprenyl-6-methoxyphenol hydroxylase-like FAD-dependent oxidoreductase
MDLIPLVVGAGPTGLSAALFLFERGVRCRIVDKAAVPSATSRAQVVNPRALELLESSGVAAAIVAEGHPIDQVVFYDGWSPMARLELGHVHPRYRMSVLPQARTEALLTEALAIRGIHPERSTELVSVSQDEQHVNALLARPDRHESLCASLLYAADGAHSVVRDSLGIQFNGSGFAETWPLYDMCLDDPLDIGNAHVSFVKDGLVFLLCIHSGLWRIFGNVQDPLEHLPSGVSPGKIEWKSSFHIADRVASRETVGRVAIGGDAAHVHAPVGARGMNLGIEDAFVFAACAADALRGDLTRLNEYGQLRHAVHEKVVGRLDKLTRLARGQPEFVHFLRQRLISVMTKFPPTAHALCELLTGLDHDVRVH